VLYSRKNVLLAAALLCLAFAASVSAQAFGYKDYCEIQLTGCPQDYDKKVLNVPPNTVALSTSLRACGVQDTARYADGVAPTVMFLIDHTKSMTTSTFGGTGSDVLGNRFRVTREFIDTLYKVYPDAQVGVVIFGEGLALDLYWDPNLVLFKGTTFYNDGANQSYLPIRRLSDPAVGGGYASGANPKWLDVIQGMFDVPPTGRSTLRNGKGGEVEEINGTNISIAFDAAREAFAAKNSTPKQNQYIVFLSDGKPDISSQNTYWYDKSYDFVNGKNTPATYTVFMKTAFNDVVPDSLEKMAANIRKNGYSASNPSSAIWAMDSDYGKLLPFMMKYILAPMLSNSYGDAKTIIISSAGVTDSAAVEDGGFTFGKQIPLDTAEITKVSMSVRYDVRIDSTFKTSDGNDSVAVVRVVEDSLFNYSFNVRRSENTPDNWLTEQDLGKRCGNGPTLDLRFDGASLIGSEVKGGMDVLQILFDNTGGLFDYDEVIVSAFNADGGLSDLEKFTLAKDSKVKWSYYFPHDVDYPTMDDGTLQHSGQDSVILFFRNPNAPLDTVRLAVPYISNAILFYDAQGDPANAVKLPRFMEWPAGKALDIYANVFDSAGNWVPDMTADAGKITWTVSAEAAALIKDGAHSIFRAETAGKSYVVTATYTDGALKISGQMTIKVVPGAPAYIEAVTDSAKINFGREPNTAYLAGDKVFAFRSGLDRKVFYAVLRDAYGNFIRMADGANWESTNTTFITTEAIDDASSAIIWKHGFTFAGYLYVIVEKGELSDKVRVTVAVENFSAAGPNPFVPGDSPIMSRLERLDAGRRFSELYRPIAANSKRGGGNGNAYNANGILVTATAPKPVKAKSGGNGVMYVTDAKAMIYDAAGRVVFRSESEDIISADGNTFGFVWDGKTISGRTAAPGSYAMRITATMADGKKFVAKVMIGVKREW
jgi:hypothetical protein